MIGSAADGIDRLPWIELSSVVVKECVCQMPTLSTLIYFRPGGTKWFRYVIHLIYHEKFPHEIFPDDHNVVRS